MINYRGAVNGNRLSFVEQVVCVWHFEPFLFFSSSPPNPPPTARKTLEYLLKYELLNRLQQDVLGSAVLGNKNVKRVHRNFQRKR
jgi:hypothetical protein